MIKMKNLLLATSAVAALSLSSTSSAATIYVTDEGSTGIQSYNYTFANDFSGYMTIGVSNEGDTEASSSLMTYADFASQGINMNLNLITNSGMNTSSYTNTLGENGTTGDIFSVYFLAYAGDMFSFDWEFSTSDIHPFNDFAFVEFENLSYEVIAEIQAVPVPAAVWLFGSGLLGLVGMARRKAA